LATTPVANGSERIAAWPTLAQYRLSASLASPPVMPCWVAMSTGDPPVSGSFSILPALLLVQ